MYISILDYSNGKVSIIYDTEDVTENMQNEYVYALLDTLGFRESEIYFMITKENPYEPVFEYVTLRELCEDVDEDRVGDHTELFWEGIHSEKEIIELIKSNPFLKRQFKM